MEIVYRPDKENANADALSCQPYLDAPQQGIAESEVQVAAVRYGPPMPLTVEELLQQKQLLSPEPEAGQLDSYTVEQRNNPSLLLFIQYLMERKLPESSQEFCALAYKAVHFTVMDKILYPVDPRQPSLQQVVVPTHLQKSVLEEYHGGRMAEHFSGPRLFKTVACIWHH